MQPLHSNLLRAWSATLRPGKRCTYTSVVIPVAATPAEDSREYSEDDHSDAAGDPFHPIAPVITVPGNLPALVTCVLNELYEVRSVLRRVRAIVGRCG